MTLNELHGLSHFHWIEYTLTCFRFAVYKNTHKFSQISIDDKQGGKKGYTYLIKWGEFSLCFQLLTFLSSVNFFVCVSKRAVLLCVVKRVNSSLTLSWGWSLNFKVITRTDFCENSSQDSGDFFKRLRFPERSLWQIFHSLFCVYDGGCLSLLENPRFFFMQIFHLKISICYLTMTMALLYSSQLLHTRLWAVTAVAEWRRIKCIISAREWKSTQGIHPRYSINIIIRNVPFTLLLCSLYKISPSLWMPIHSPNISPLASCSL